MYQQPKAHIRTSSKRWSFIWRCFFPVSILKALNLYKSDMDKKSKHVLRKIVEKFYEEFNEDQELSDDTKKERL